MALSRLSLNANYEGDLRSVGDRGLAIWIGAGYYLFATSTTGNPNVY